MTATIGDIFTLMSAGGETPYFEIASIQWPTFTLKALNDGQLFSGYTIEQMLSYGYGHKKAEPVKTKKNRKRSYKNRPLYLVASKNGMTHKGIASKVNERKVFQFGNSVTQALSKYEDRFGKKIDLKDALVFKLVPNTIRWDKRRNKARIGSEVK